MKTIALPSGEMVPAFGIGTWCLGDHRAHRAEELATLRLALDRGVTLIDTAEMYGDGRSEELVGEAIAGRRDDAFIVSKVLPHRASKRAIGAACDASLRRLRTDRIDLYLLHWRGRVPLAETVDGFIELQREGKIRHWGVSNFDIGDMRELVSVPGGDTVASNQLLYNLVRRGIEWELAPWLYERGIPVMAYSPIEQAKLVRSARLGRFAEALGIRPVQVALAWLLAKDGVIVVPRTGKRAHLLENLQALDHPLGAEPLAELDRLFPPPSEPRPLEMI
jgi:diketogulonate reductase-like aldo/keto reductase